MDNSSIGLHKHQLDTPCLVINKPALDHNLDIMRQHGRSNRVNIRPHSKTHKCSQLARLQIEHGAVGICVAKVSEAEVLVKQGIPNILITSPVVTKTKITKLTACVKRSPSLIVVIDNEENATQLNNAAQSINTAINVLVDLDSGIGRTGVALDNALALGEKIHRMEWLTLVGIQCYAGNLQHIFSFDERRNKSLQIMQQASEMVKTFKAKGLPCPILTGTGTGTFDIDIEASEVTEIQPGSYTVMDVEYAAIESKEGIPPFTTFKPAMTLLTTVISSNRNEHVTVDAGTKSIYVDATNKPQIISHKDLQYDWGGFGDEHGKITSSNNGPLPRNSDVIELIVPHCDPTINLFDKFYITDQNNMVIDVWKIDMRGKSQ